MYKTLLELQLRLELAFYCCEKQIQLKNNCKTKHESSNLKNKT